MLGPSGFFLSNVPDDRGNSYHSLELIHSSENGFSELYRGSKNGRFFVYKALKPEFRGNMLYEELLEKDFNIGFSLNHSGICQYYAKIEHPDAGNCIVMEWVDGCTLEELIASGGPDKKLSRKIIGEMCDALGYMHRKQVIHRDLKPENILITHNGQNVKIIDFGLSDTDSYNKFKSPAGTRIYASPELIAGEPIDNRSDIWSLGVIIGEMYPSYRRIVKRCLARQVEKRYPTAEAVKTAMDKEDARKLVSSTIFIMLLLGIGVAGSAIYKGMTPQPEEALPLESPAPLQEAEASDSTKTDTLQPKRAKAASDHKPIITAPTKETESIDAESLENLFNEASGQIL